MRHEIIAMVVPRPVFLSTGNGPDLNPDGTVKRMDPNDPNIVASRGPVEQQAANINDAWVDPKGTFLAGVGAGPVYECSAGGVFRPTSSHRSRPHW